MSEKKNKKRLNHERESDNSSPNFIAEQAPSRRAKIDASTSNETAILRSTPSFGIDRNSSLSQSEAQTGDFDADKVNKADDPLLKVLIAAEELNAGKKKKFDGKFEELSDQFRQKGITKEMRTCIDKFTND